MCLDHSINQSISTYLVPRLHKSGPTRHYKCHHSTRTVKTSAVIKAHIKKMSLEFQFESSSSMFGRRAFSVAGPMEWNSLPDSLRDPARSTDSFKSALKTHLFAALRDD